MSQDELLPEELNDYERLLIALAPRASRIDRDRLMIRLGEQSAARGSTPWKWATAASLMLALALGLRPAFAPPGSAPTQLATQTPAKASRAEDEAGAQDARPTEPDNGAAPAPVRPIDTEVDWVLALASGRFDSSGTLTVRPRPASSALASHVDSAPVADDSPNTSPSVRTQTLRWGDRPLMRDAVDQAPPPTS